MRRAAAASALAVLVAATTGGAGAAPAAGLWGTVRRGPITPVCVEGKPCYAPAVGVRLLFVRAGAVRARAVSGSKGGYRVPLVPGTYSVRLADQARGRLAGAIGVRVASGRYRRLDLVIDTGIR